MTEKEIIQIAYKCGIIAWTKHDYLADKKDFRDLPIDEGMDGDRACLMQFAKALIAIERARAVRIAQIEHMTPKDIARVIADDQYE